MAKLIENLKSYPKSKVEVLNDIQNKYNKSIYKLPLFQLSEIMILAEILTKENIINQISNKYDQISFNRYAGPDIIFINSKTKSELKVEVKSSVLKRDYMNTGKYKNKKNVKFWGNQLKVKDFSQTTGILIADILILVFCDHMDKKGIDEDSNWEFLVLNRIDVDKLEPKSSIFFPTFCSTIMANNGQSYFTDEYSSLKKGIVQLIKYKKSGDQELDNEVRLDFQKVSKEVNCFLYQNEHKKLVEVLWNNEHENQWQKLLVKEIIQTGKFTLTNLIENYKCGFLMVPKNAKDQKNCKFCQEKIKMSF